jgi:hypothetical protein
VAPCDETAAHFASWVDEPKTRENEANLSPGEMNRFAAQVVPIEIIAIVESRFSRNCLSSMT